MELYSAKNKYQTQIPKRCEIRITAESPFSFYVNLCYKKLFQDNEEEIILAACGYTVEKLFLISSILSEKIGCLFRLNKTIVNECLTCFKRCKSQGLPYPKRDELINRAMESMGTEEYSTLHKCNKEHGFPFLVTFTQRLSLKNIYSPEDPGYVKPSSVSSHLSLSQIMDTYVGEATMTKRKFTGYKGKPKAIND